jgi:hypothetical protein
MDDQNPTNKPIDPKMALVNPNVLEDITPAEVPPVAAPLVTTTTTTTQPVITATPIEPLTSTPLPGVSPLLEPTPMMMETTTTTTETPTVNEPIPVQTEVPAPKTEEVQMPERKPKKKIMPAIMGILALFLVVGVAGAAYYVSNQLTNRVAVAPNAAKKASASCGYGCDGAGYDSKGNEICVCYGGAVQNDTDGANCPSGQFSCGSFCCLNNTQSCGSNSCVDRVTVTATPTVEGANCPSGQFSCGSWCCRNNCDSCGPDANTQCVTRSPLPASCDTTLPTLTPTPSKASGCVDYSYIANSTSEQQNQIICSPDKSHINTVTFATAGTIRVHLNNVYVGTTITLTKDGANTTVTKVAEGASGYTTADFEATVVAGTYTMAVKLGNETANSLGFINPTSAGICERYGGPNDISSRITTAALSGFGIETTTGIDAPFQCWSDGIQGNDTDQRGQLDANYDFNDFDVEIGYKGTTTVGACTKIEVFKKVDGAYGTTALTDAQLQSLIVGDVLKFAVADNMAGLNGRFRITIGGTTGNWLTGTANGTSITYSDYTIPSAGTYTFEGQVTTTAQ